MLRFMAGLLAVTAALMAEAIMTPPGGSFHIATTQDVGRLEQIVLAPEFVGQSPWVMDDADADIPDRRTAAYARLGELATAGSLGAVRRIDAHLFSGRAPLVAPLPDPGAQGERTNTRRVSREVSLSAVYGDSDGDGWADLDEERLGLDPLRADSDGDGLPDGRDSCPNFAAPAHESPLEVEASVILRKAVLAVLGLPPPRSVLLVKEGTPRIQLDGFAGFAIFGINQERWLARHGRGDVFAHWAMANRNAADADVDIGYWFGPTWAVTWSVHLRHLEGDWYVTAQRVAQIA